VTKKFSVLHHPTSQTMQITWIWLRYFDFFEYQLLVGHGSMAAKYKVDVVNSDIFHKLFPRV
jgi:hypothetical protein